jgi:hypothetical protein
MYLGNNAAIRGCQEYFNRCAAAGSPIGATQTPTAYDNAASFTSASSQSLTSTAANLQCQSQSFTVAGWFFMPSNAPAYSALITQGSHPVNAGGGFTLQRFDNLNLVYLTIRNDNASNSVAVNSSAFVPSTWNFIECGWDSTLNQSFISLNGGTRAFSTAVAGWTFPNTTNITRLGRDPFGSFLTGNLAGWGLWKRVLTSGTNSEIAGLFNNGAGRTYASLDTGLRNNLISWWALNGTSTAVSLTDSHTGGNNLTNTGSVTAPNIGPVVTALSDPRQLIIDFAQGIDRLGLWNSMVCWPLRSSQNAASGTTAFSLGGLGQFNGTLVNAPVWGADGVSGFLQNSSRRIETSVGYNFSTQNSIFACARKTAAGDLRLVGQSNETPLFVGSADIRYFNGATAGGTATHPGTNVRSTYSHAFGSSTVVGIVNGGTPVSSAYSPNNLAMQFFIGQGGSNGWVGDISFFAYFSQQIATSTHSQLHSLYRQTLGLGLGLP